jgi:hypothetical protein
MASPSQYSRGGLITGVIFARATELGIQRTKRTVIETAGFCHLRKEIVPVQRLSRPFVRDYDGF